MILIQKLPREDANHMRFEVFEESERIAMFRTQAGVLTYLKGRSDNL